MKSPNIILITVDCLRSDHLGCYGYMRNTSPNIDKLASRGVLFLEAISNGGCTPCAFPSILASALPPAGFDEVGGLSKRSTTLAELLKRAGYHTAGFHCNPFLTSFFGYHRGFDVFSSSLAGRSFKEVRTRLQARVWRSRETLLARLIVRLGRMLRPVLFRVAERPIVTASEMVAKVIPWVRSHREGYFLWLHFMDVHGPYTPPARYVRQFQKKPLSRSQMVALWEKIRREPERVSPAEVETVINLYDGAIRYVDDTIGLLLSALGDSLSGTVVIVTADHGEEFGEHGRFVHLTVYDTLLHVPLIMAGPGIGAGHRVGEQVSLIDLPPTIAEMAGQKDVSGFHGRSLLGLMNGEEMASRATVSTFLIGHKQRKIAYRRQGWKYICTSNLREGRAPTSEEVYNLADDPAETRNLHGLNDEQADRFELEAKNEISRFEELKRGERTFYEKQRIKAKVKKLRF